MTDTTTTTSVALPSRDQLFSRLIDKKLLAVQAALPAVGKDGRNQGQGFNYRSIDAILSTLHPLLRDHGVYLLPEVLKIVTEPRQKGGQAIVTVKYRFRAEDGSESSVVIVGEGQDPGDKAVSKAMTMALKTALWQMFTLAYTEDDPDGQTVELPTVASSQAMVGPRPRVGPQPASTATAPVVANEESEETHGVAPLSLALAVLTRARELPPQRLTALKRWMTVDQQMGSDFSVLSEAQLKLVDEWIGFQAEPEDDVLSTGI